MPRKPVVTLPTDFFETGNVRALCMKKGGEEALIVYLHLLCMAVKQDRECRLMLYGNIPLDDATIARLMYKTELLEIIRMINSLDNPMQKRFISLVLFTGMRRGEVLGLRWEDINVEEGMISVSRAVSYTTNQPILSTPKTKNGIRKIPLDPQMLQLLQPLESTGFIIGGETPLTKTVFVRMFNQIRERIDLHGATPHVFRHSYLSMLNQAGVDPKTIQAIGGHGNIMMTFNRYVHSDEKQIALAGKKFNTLFAQ